MAVTKLSNPHDFSVPGVEYLLDVLAAGEEDLDDVGDLIAVASSLGPVPAVHAALGVEHQPRVLILKGRSVQSYGSISMLQYTIKVQIVRCKTLLRYK